MRKEKINLHIDLDEQNVCEQIQWEASNAPDPNIQHAKALSLALWDKNGQGTAKIDLWTKDMDVYEMKQFIIETISGLADTVKVATNDEIMAMEMEILCKQLSQRLEKELKGQNPPK